MRLSRKGVEIYVFISEKVLRIGIRDRIDTGLKQPSPLAAEGTVEAIGIRDRIDTGLKQPRRKDLLSGNPSNWNQRPD